MKRYFLIFNPAGTSPPAITESKRAADYWAGQGCEVETFTRGTAAKLAEALREMRIASAWVEDDSVMDAAKGQADAALAEYRSGQA